MKYWICLSLLGMLFSCEPKVVFDHTQPTGIDPIEEIPERYWGSYRCQSDSTLVIIEPHIAYQQYNYQIKMTIDQIEETENCSLADGGLYLPGRKQCYPIKYIHEDTVVGYVTDIDTLFSFSDDQVIKPYRGALIINQQLESDDWIIWTLGVNTDGSLQLNYLDLPEEIENIAEISADYDKVQRSKDIEQYVIRPTMREFDDLITTADYQLECDVLIPVSLEIDDVFRPRPIE